MDSNAVSSGGQLEAITSPTDSAEALNCPSLLMTADMFIGFATK
jgi:hypothetical protein